MAFAGGDSKGLVALAIVGGVALSGCVALRPQPGVYDVRREPVRLHKFSMHLTLVKPAATRPPSALILYASGDAGWLGASKVVLEHMAEVGYTIAAYDSRELVSDIKRAGGEVSFAAAAAEIGALLVEAKRLSGLPASTPTIVTGFSRGASLVVFAAGEPSLQAHICGGVAMALTRESDYIIVPDAAHRPASIQLDGKGRILTYPAIARLGPIPIAVIQSAGDSYVPADEARRLFGPDTPTRRLYEVDARNHGFGGGREELLHALDESLAWITATLPRGDTGR